MSAAFFPAPRSTFVAPMLPLPDRAHVHPAEELSEEEPERYGPDKIGSDDAGRQR